MRVRISFQDINAVFHQRVHPISTGPSALTAAVKLFTGGAIIHYNRIKDDERYKTFVAIDSGDVVGFVSSVYSYEIGREVGFMHIVGLAVKKEKQSQGIGKKLIEHMEYYAKDKGISSIVLNSGIQRTAAHAFYQHNGYDKGSWCFSKRI